jgi:hypothetical protein
MHADDPTRRDDGDPDYSATCRALFQEARALRARDADDAQAEHALAERILRGEASSDDMLVLTRRRRETTDRLEVITALQRHVGPLAEEQAQREVLRAFHARVDEQEARFAVADTEAERMQVLIEELGACRARLEAALNWDDLRATLFGIAGTHRFDAVRAFDRRYQLDEQLIARVRISGALRDDEGVGRASSMRAVSFPAWVRGFTSKLLTAIRDAAGVAAQDGKE